MRILIVEDNEDMRTLLHTAITRFAKGYEAVAVSNGKDAIDQLLRGGFDVISLDLILPDMHGTRVIREAREQGALIPKILISSGNARSSIARHEATLGAIQFMMKPFGIFDYVEAIEALGKAA